MCQAGKTMLDINSLELSSPSTAVCLEKCKQQAWLKQLCLSPCDIRGRLPTRMSCTAHAHTALGEGLSWLMWVLCDCGEHAVTPLRCIHMFWATKWLSLFMHPRFFELHHLRLTAVGLTGIHGHGAAGSQKMDEQRLTDFIQWLIFKNDQSSVKQLKTFSGNILKLYLKEATFALKLYNPLLPLIWNTLNL